MLSPTPSRKRNLGSSNEQDCASHSPHKRCSGDGIRVRCAVGDSSSLSVCEQVNDVKRSSWAPKRPTCISCLKFFGTFDKVARCASQVRRSHAAAVAGWTLQSLLRELQGRSPVEVPATPRADALTAICGRFAAKNTTLVGDAIEMEKENKDTGSEKTFDMDMD